MEAKPPSLRIANTIARGQIHWTQLGRLFRGCSGRGLLHTYSTQHTNTHTQTVKSAHAWNLCQCVARNKTTPIMPHLHVYRHHIFAVRVCVRLRTIDLGHILESHHIFPERGTCLDLGGASSCYVCMNLTGSQKDLPRHIEVRCTDTDRTRMVRNFASRTTNAHTRDNILINRSGSPLRREQRPTYNLRDEMICAHVRLSTLELIKHVLLLATSPDYKLLLSSA